MGNTSARDPPAPAKAAETRPFFSGVERGLRQWRRGVLDRNPAGGTFRTADF